MEWGAGLSFLGVVLVALIGLWTKRTPEKKSAKDYSDSQMRLLMERLDKADESNSEMRAELEKQWRAITELQQKVHGLMALIQTLKRYITVLEDSLSRLSGRPHQRPDEIDEIFKQH